MVYATLFVFTVEKNVFIIHSIITYYVCIITEWALSFFCFFFFFGLSGIITRSKKKTKKQRVFLFIWISYRVQEAKCGMQECRGGESRGTYVGSRWFIRCEHIVRLLQFLEYCLE